MAAGGTFLRVLATGTLAVVMAAVPPPPDHHGPSPRVTDPDHVLCYVYEVYVQEGKPTYIASSETGAKTLYLHTSEAFDALRLDVTTNKGSRVMWVPYFPGCFRNYEEGWIETLSYCTVDPAVDLVVCGFNTPRCRFICHHDLPASDDIQFYVAVIGHSRWRSTAPPYGCKVSEIKTEPSITHASCIKNPLTSTTAQWKRITAPTTGVTSPITDATAPSTGAPPPTTGAPKPTTGASPPTTGAPQPTTGVTPSTTGAPPMTSAAPDKNCSGVAVRVAGAVHVG